MHFGLIDYAYLDKAQGNDHRRRCIDGGITGRGNCVGYCQCNEHPGFLTARHCTEHQCKEKGCHYFMPKLRQEKAPAKRPDADAEIVTIAAGNLCIRRNEDHARRQSGGKLAAEVHHTIQRLPDW